MITETQKQLVQESFKKVYPIADVAAELFYSRLFKLNPGLSKLFKGDMKEQGKKLFNMLRSAVSMLNRLEELVPVLEDLGSRHANYGVRDEDYDTVAEAFLWTLEKGLGNDFTPECKDAWVAVYTVVANTMKSGVKEELLESTY